MRDFPAPETRVTLRWSSLSPKQKFDWAIENVPAGLPPGWWQDFAESEGIIPQKEPVQ